MKKGVDKQHLFLYYMSSSAAVHYRKQNNDAWLSLVERCVRDAEVAGSNPVASTKALRIPWLRDSFFAYKEIQNVIFQRIFCAWLV